MGTFIVSFVGNGFVQSAQDWLPLRRFSPQTRRRLLVRAVAAAGSLGVGLCGWGTCLALMCRAAVGVGWSVHAHMCWHMLAAAAAATLIRPSSHR